MHHFMEDLVTYHEFATYLEHAPYYTLQMLRKQTIKLEYMVDDEIVSISPSATSYIDNKYH